MISIIDIISLVAYMGSVTFLLGTVLLAFLYFKFLPGTGKVKKIVLIIVQLIAAFILSVIFWMYWNFGLDLMFLCFLLPGLAAEIITIPLFYLPLRKRAAGK